MIKNLLLTLFFTFFVFFANSQQYDDTIFSPKVKSVKFFSGENQLDYPILVLNSGSYLQLRFDILQNQPVNLQYSLIHCNWDWTDQDVMEDEFVDGYYVNDILDYSQSFNTNVSYVNYKITLPNENLRLLLSGNYIVKVFLASNPDSVLLQKRFFVVENNVSISANIHQSSIAQYKSCCQEVDFSFDVGNLNLDQPWNYTKAAIYQNFRFDKVRFLDQPKFYQGSQMIYDYELENMFLGGNEFRSFNTSQFRFKSGKVYKTMFLDSVYYCFLLPDNKNFAHVSYHDDNGNFVVYAKPADDIWSEADYVFVNFQLLSKNPIPNGDVYVIGAFSNWKILPENKLSYDPKLKSYVGNILLKQGIYDYQYIFVPDEGEPTLKYTEGNFYQTRNDYLILVYYQEQAPYYDRIIGYRLVRMR